jgi:hypothetical protein
MVAFSNAPPLCRFDHERPRRRRPDNVEAKNERRGTTTGAKKAAHHATGRMTNPNKSLGTGILSPSCLCECRHYCPPLLCSINPAEPAGDVAGIEVQSPENIQ